MRERAQRDAIGVGLHMLPDDTVFICSDCDEIVNPDKLELMVNKAVKDNVLIRPSMSMHYGRADRQLITPEGALFEWRNAFICSVAFLKSHSTLSALRSSQENVFVGDRDYGWHFSWMGDSERRLKKLKSYAHWETDKPDVEKICETFKATPGDMDMLGRSDHLITTYPLDLLPEKLFELDRVKDYLLPDYVD